jgi:predicted nucleotidyltransferase
LINDKNDVIHYTFKKNGELIVSTNGNFVKGKWEILSSDKILIENEKLILQLESLFFNENIIVLSKTSKSEELFVLINEEIKDKNPLEYLKNLKKIYDEDFGAEEFFYILLVGIIIFFTIVIVIVW